MTDTKMLTRVISVLERDKNIPEEMALALNEYKSVHGLIGVSVFETDFMYCINRLAYAWKSGEGNDYSYKYNTGRNEGIFFPRKDSRRFEELLSQNEYIGIGDIADDDLRQTVLSVADVEAGNYFICPMYKNIEVVGFFLFERKEGEAWSDEIREVLMLSSKVVSLYVSRLDSDAASKMKTEFLSRMSHEIRTPLNAIIGMTAIAKSSLDNCDRVDDCLIKIDASTKYLLSIVNDILDMSKIESGKISLNTEKFSIDGMLQGLEALLAPQAQAKMITLKIIREYSDNIVYGDELKISQILINLLGNALKFTPKGGKIYLRVEELLKEDDNIVMRFFVKDTGIGIEDRNLDKIFRAFEQADENITKNYGGTGLGLSISYNLVKLMGGILKVDSTVGKGSDFYFTIAFKQAVDGEEKDEPRPRKQAHQKEEYDFHGKRALIAEDNELNAEIAQVIMEMVGFETETAENGRVAYDMFVSRGEDYYDVILMDVRMPEMDGLAATRAIRSSALKYGGSIPILAMTANAFDKDVNDSISSGMNGHLSKPVDTERLYKELKSIIK